MERIKFVALIILLPVLLVSCAHSGMALDYEALPFTARFALSANGINIMGTITAGALTDTPRDVCITFESPESLSGISVERKDSNITTTLDGISLPSESSRWLDIAELFTLGGAVSSAKSESLGGVSCSLVTVTAKNGEKYSV